MTEADDKVDDVIFLMQCVRVSVFVQVCVRHL